MTTILGACSREPKDRVITFEGVENARELGGLRMQDGSTIKYGLLVRSGNLSRATDADEKLLKKRFGLSNVVDFRFEAEMKGAPDRVMKGVKYTNLSTLPTSVLAGFSGGRADAEELKTDDLADLFIKIASHPKAQEMARVLYPAIVTDTLSQKYYGDFLRTVLDAKGGILWHCSQGKDRVGWGTAFLLGALGASRETIVEDFDMSNVYYAPYVETLSAKVIENGGGEAEVDFIKAMIGVSRENFESTLDLIDTTWGSLDAYIENALGFTAQERENLKAKYLKK